jgi:four helix bundle protein
MQPSPLMTPEELKARTTDFGADVARFTTQLRRRPEARSMADQLTDSATAVPSNYRSACRARSHREFVSKLSVALEEADESVGWLEILVKSGLVGAPEVESLLDEARQLVAILGASRRTAEERRRPRKRDQ